MSLVQAYSKKYFIPKIKAVADAQYEEHLKEVEEGLTKKIELVEFRNRIIRQYWEDEPQEIRDQIDAYREHRYLHGASSDEEDSEEGGADDDDDDGDDDSDSDEDDQDHNSEDEDEDKREGGSSTVSKKGKGKQKQPVDPIEVKAKEYHEYVPFHSHSLVFRQVTLVSSERSALPKESYPTYSRSFTRPRDT